MNLLKTDRDFNLFNALYEAGHYLTGVMAGPSGKHPRFYYNQLKGALDGDRKLQRQMAS